MVRLAIAVLLVVPWTCRADPGAKACAPPAAISLSVAAEDAQKPDWQWRCEPFVGAGWTCFDRHQFNVILGLDVGTFPDSVPVAAGHDFGGMLAQIGSVTAVGPCAKLTQVAGVPVWVGALLWKDERFKSDITIFASKPFEFSVGW